MKVTMLLADAVQAVSGKLFVLGGGWSVTGPAPAPSALAIKIDVPWNEGNKKHRFRLTLVDGDAQPVDLGGVVANRVRVAVTAVHAPGEGWPDADPASPDVALTEITVERRPH